MAFGAFALAAAMLLLLDPWWQQARAKVSHIGSASRSARRLELRVDKVERALVRAVEVDTAAEMRKAAKGVLGMSTLLLETDLDVHQREYAQIVRDIAVSMDAMTQPVELPAPQAAAEAAPAAVTDLVSSRV